MVANILARSVLFAVLLGACLSSACGQMSQTAPTEIPQAQAPSVQAGTPAQVSPLGASPVPSSMHGPAGVDTSHLCTETQHGVSCAVVAFTESRISVRFQNASSEAQRVNLAIYERRSQTFADQHLCERCSALEQTLDAGQARTLEADLPDCTVQIDEHTGLKVAHPPHALGTLLGYATTAGAFCATPVDPKPPTKPPVTPPVTPPPPVDVCPNLEGHQTAVPDGYALIDGLCVPQQPPAVQCPDFAALLASHDKAAVLQYVSPFNVHATSDTEVCVDVVVHDLPVGCTVPLSLGSYQRYNQQVKFPQKFIGASLLQFGNGTYGCAIPVKKQIGCYQVDLRFGQTQAEDLTQANESADYGWRTLDWISNPKGATCAPIAVE